MSGKVAPRHAQPISDVSQERLLVLQLHTMAALCIHHDLFLRADPIDSLRGIINPNIAYMHNSSKRLVNPVHVFAPR
jgi:hypothetical protein